MVSKKIEEIKESDLQSLIDNKVLESKTIEYKKELPNNSDSSKKEFLADVTSLANSSGGDLIFGIEQDNQIGEPKEVCGIGIENADKEKTRLDDIIRTGIEPRILSVSIQEIPLINSKYAFIIRIPKSWNGPHRVILGGHAKFYARNSSGKYEMDVDELRVAFNLSETLAERIRNFRTDRIAKIMADETPVPLFQNPKIVLHLIPVYAFNPSQKYNIDGIFAKRHDKLPLVYRHVLNGRYNFDGLFTYSENEEGVFSAYTQLYRNGITEAVDSLLIRPTDEGLFIPSSLYETKLFEALSSYIKLFTELNVEPPIFVFLNLLGVKGYKMGIKRELYFDKGHPIDRDLLLLPEVIIDDYGTNATDVLKPIFDLVWNACGFQRSLNFDADGNLIPR